MGLLILLQVMLDLGFIAVVTLLLIERSKSKTMEDPRLSRGLQLLSSKIAILQDLMDRSETMARQLTQLIDGKQQDIQERIEEVEICLHKIQKATQQSKEVAEIFQDRIPHQEIIERQTTHRYLQAAKMAHQGFSPEDISKQVDIPRGELELIIKVNRDKMIMTPEPAWATSHVHTRETFQEVSLREPMKTDSIAVAPIQAATPMYASQTIVEPVVPPAPATVATLAPIPTSTSTATAAAVGVPTPTQISGPNAQEKARNIRPFVFKRISVLNELG